MTNPHPHTATLAEALENLVDYHDTQCQDRALLTVLLADAKKALEA